MTCVSPDRLLIVQPHGFLTNRPGTIAAIAASSSSAGPAGEFPTASKAIATAIPTAFTSDTLPVSHNLFKENYTGPVFLKRVFGHMNAVSRCLNNLRGVGGCEITPNEFGGFDINAGAGRRVAFSGAVEINGQWYYGLDSNPALRYVVVPLDGSPPREDAGPMPNPNPAYEIWYPKATTYGDIHVGSNR